MVKSWKANAEGQKLKKLIYSDRCGFYDDRYDATTIFESFPNLAVSVDL